MLCYIQQESRVAGKQTVSFFLIVASSYVNRRRKRKEDLRALDLQEDERCIWTSASTGEEFEENISVPIPEEDDVVYNRNGEGLNHMSWVRHRNVVAEWISSSRTLGAGRHVV